MESGEDGERRGRREAMTESDEKSNNFSTNLLLITNILSQLCTTGHHRKQTKILYHLEHMIFCTPHIISFFKKGQDLFDGLASRIPFVLLVLTIRKQLQIPFHNSKSSRLHCTKSADTILVEQDESFGVTEPSSLAIARNAAATETRMGLEEEAALKH